MAYFLVVFNKRAKQLLRPIDQFNEVDALNLLLKWHEDRFKDVPEVEVKAYGASSIDVVKKVHPEYFTGPAPYMRCIICKQTDGRHVKGCPSKNGQ